MLRFVFLFLFFTSPLCANEIIIVSPNGIGTNYSEEQLLDKFELHAISTQTYWTGPEVFTFEGVLLEDLLEEHGLTQIKNVGVLALDDYVASIPIEAVRKHRPILAFRQNNGPISDGFGPFWIVSDISDDPLSDKNMRKGFWVWQALKFYTAKK